MQMRISPEVEAPFGAKARRADILFNAPPLATIDLMVGGGRYAGPSEYEKLIALQAGWTRHPDYPRVAWCAARASGRKWPRASGLAS